jgi:hypothetical protein
MFELSHFAFAVGQRLAVISVSTLKSLRKANSKKPGFLENLASHFSVAFLIRGAHKSVGCHAYSPAWAWRRCVFAFTKTWPLRAVPARRDVTLLFRWAGSCRDARGDMPATCFSKSPCFPVFFPKHVSLVFCIFPLMRLPVRFWDGYIFNYSFRCSGLLRVPSRRCVTPVANAMVREMPENCRADLRSRKRPARRVSTLCQPSRQKTACFPAFLRKQVYIRYNATFEKKFRRGRREEASRWKLDYLSFAGQLELARIR